MLIDNILLACDSYKSSHYKQYPPGTEYIYSYIESRGGLWDETIFFGTQAFIKQYLSRPITMDDIDEADAILTAHGEPFNREGWEHILNAHAGRLPVLIKAAPEGTLIPTHNVLVTIVNTDPKCAWLTSYLETALLRAIWYPTTVATASFQNKVKILRALNETSDDAHSQIGFKLHDFGARGVSSQESAMLGGMAHLVNFMGTDTVEGLVGAKRYYNAGISGFSIPAAEHSTITAWGREHETDAYRNMLRQFAKPGSIVAVVSDSYDLMNAVNTIWGGTLKQEVIDSGATIVVRPDSGNPLTVPVDVVSALADKFGFTVNTKGYKVLPSCVRVIQGDGITSESLPVIIANMKAAGFSLDNLAFGMGGGLLQQVNRDTQKFAMKASAISINGTWIDVYKDPITDPGKRSKRGRFALVRHPVTGFATVPLVGNEGRDELLTVYKDGVHLNQTDFASVRALANQAASLRANFLGKAA